MQTKYACFPFPPHPQHILGRICILDDRNLIGIFKYRLLLLVGRLDGWMVVPIVKYHMASGFRYATKKLECLEPNLGAQMKCTL